MLQVFFKVSETDIRILALLSVLLGTRTVNSVSVTPAILKLYLKPNAVSPKKQHCKKVSNNIFFII
jgi:hypothetical protein